VYSSQGNIRTEFTRRFWNHNDRFGFIGFIIFLRESQLCYKFRSPVDCLLILNGHSFYSFFICTEKGIEIFCLPFHKINVLQPVDRTLFKSIKTNLHPSTTNFTHNNPNVAITKFRKLFSPTWKIKGTTFAEAIRGFECTVVYNLNSSTSHEDKLLSSAYFLRDSVDSFSVAFVWFHQKAIKLYDHQLSSRNQTYKWSRTIN
jgi:hypothetical protein